MSQTSDLSELDRIMSTPDEELPPVDAVTVGKGIGFFGKLPSHGDFLSRRVDPDLLHKWEEWLGAGLDRSREKLGPRWLEAYLASPVWRFAIGGGACGSMPIAGVIMPSLDRVGRYYPLTILAILNPGESVAEIAADGGEWFDRVEALALSCLADDFDFARFDAALAAESVPTGSAIGTQLEAACPEGGPAEVIAPLLGQLIEGKIGAYSLWWRSATETVLGSCRVAAGLPSAEMFTRMIG